MTRNEPLLLRFAQPIPEPTPQIVRYDQAKQVSEVNEDGNWVQSWRNSDPLWRGTKTAVHNEPTE
jgi:hypothetical protein